MQAVATWALMLTLDEVHRRRISFRVRVILESLRAHMISKYICGTETPESANSIYEVQIRDRYGEMQRVRALIEYSATSISMSSKLLQRLGLRPEVAHTTILGLKGHVIEHVNDSRTTTMTVQYMKHLAPVDELEVLVVLIKAYDLVLMVPVVPSSKYGARLVLTITLVIEEPYWFRHPRYPAKQAEGKWS
jgi:hypothetical protein